MKKRIFITMNQIKCKWKLIVIFSLISVLLAAVFSFFILNPYYESSVKIFIGKEKFKNISTEYTNEEVQMYQSLLKTYCEVMTSEDLIERAINQSNVDKDIKDVLKNIDIDIVKDSQIMVIKYTDQYAQVAYDMLYNITNNFIRNSRKLYKNSNVVVLQQVSVLDKSISNYARIIMIIAGILGGFGGVVYIFIREYFMTTFNTKESIEEYFGVNVLAMIPNE